MLQATRQRISWAHICTNDVGLHGSALQANDTMTATQNIISCVRKHETPTTYKDRRTTTKTIKPCTGKQHTPQSYRRPKLMPTKCTTIRTHQVSRNTQRLLNYRDVWVNSIHNVNANECVTHISERGTSLAES
jgi:hypothetical protein